MSEDLVRMERWIVKTDLIKLITGVLHGQESSAWRSFMSATVAKGLTVTVPAHFNVSDERKKN